MKVILILFVLISFNTYADEEPTYYNISIMGAVIGPTKIGNQKWDTGFGSLKGIVPLATIALPGILPLSSSLISKIIEKAPTGTSAPDVFGNVQMVGPTTKDALKVLKKPIQLATKQNLTKNSYTPSLFAEYQSWPIYKNTRIRIELWDKDISENDLIGKVELNSKDLDKATKEEKPVYIKVADQSQNQLLYIQISVTKSTTKTPRYSGLVSNL